MSTTLSEQAEDSDAVPLVVDVDGTLLATDLLQEAALQFVALHPWRAWEIAVWLRSGKAAVKSRLADHVDPDMRTLPMRPEVLRLIRQAQAAGRPVYLASASDLRYVQALAERIGGIAGVFGTETGRNLSGRAKAEQLETTFGHKGYDYVGDHAVDVPVWRSARRALVVASSSRLLRQVQAAFPEAEIVARPRRHWPSYLGALRPHQWAKNVLLFLPALAGHRFELPTLVPTAFAFVCFCLAASSAYLINDLLDVPGDREHPRKMHRPFAAAKLPIPHGIAMAFVLMVAAVLLSLVLPTPFLGVLLFYVATTLGYSLVLKRRPLLDVIVLAGLYALRVYGGLAATNYHTTQWLLMFSLFLFLSLALVKRCSELVPKRLAESSELVGRAYRVEDLAVLLPMAAAAGYGAVFVIVLYLYSPEVQALYTSPNRLVLMCPLMTYWISRVLLLCNRGELHHDPVVFALTDRVSWFLALCAAAVLVLAA